MDGFDTLPSLGLDEDTPKQPGREALGIAGGLPSLLGDAPLADHDPSRAGLAVYSALRTDPDHHAKALDIAAATGLPPDTVGRNMAEAERMRRARSLDLDALRRDYPKTYAYLEDRDRAALGLDDLTALQKLERLWGKAKAYGADIGAAFEEGQGTVELSGIGYDRLLSQMGIGGPVADDRMARAQVLKDRKQEADDYGFFASIPVETARTLPTTIETLGTGLKTAAGGAALGAGTALVAGQLGPQVALPEELVTVPGGAILGGRVGFKSGAAYGAFKLEAGLAFDEFADITDKTGKALDPNIAAGAAVAVGTVNAGLEMLSLNAVLDTVPGGKRLLGMVGRQGMKEALENPAVQTALLNVTRRYATAAATEGATETAQELITAMGGELAKIVQGGEFEKMNPADFWTRVLQAGEAGFKAGLGMGLPGTIASTAVEVRKARRAQDHAAGVKETLDTAAESKLRERAPGTFEAFMQSVGQGEDGPAEVLVSAKPVVEMMQAAGQDPVTFFDGLGVTLKDVQAAVATGGDVAVDFGRFAARLATDPNRDAVVRHVREDIGALTASEAEIALADAQEQTAADLEDMRKWERERQAIEAPADAVFDQVYSQLRAAGIYDAEGARAAAELYRQHALALSEAHAAEGKAFDPLSFLEGYGLRIERGAEAQNRGRALVDGIDILLEELRNPNLRKTPAQINGPSLLDFLSGLGLSRQSLEASGVLGDLTGAGIDAWHQGRPGVPAIIRDAAEALGIDDATLAAWEAGYLPEAKTERPGIDALLNAARDELAGRPRYSEKNANPAAQEREALLATLERALHDLGVDLATTDNATAKATLSQALNQAGADGALFQAAAAPFRPFSYAKAEKAFNRQLDAVMQGHRRGILELGETPPVLQALGFEGIDVAVTKSVIEKAIGSDRQDGTASGKHAAKVSPADVADLVRAIADPVAVYESDPSHGPGRLVVITDMTGRDGNPIAVAVGSHGSLSDRDVNYLASIHSRSAAPGRLLYARDEKSLATLPYSPGKVQGTTASQGPAPSILTKADIINRAGAVFWQPDGGAGPSRGSITFAQGETVIRLFKDADLSTFLHETGHLFLKQMMDVAARENAPARIREDFAATLKWLGVESAADLDTTTAGEKAVAAHEKWAKGFEAYLREGKAPSPELQSAFARFKAWLMRIYSAMKGMGAEIGDDIRGVFDRMLATEAQIAAAEEANQFRLSPVISELLTEGERRQLEEAARRAHDEAVSALEHQRIRIEQREAEKAWKEERAKVRAEVEPMVWSRPVYQAWHFLTKGELRGRDAPAGLKGAKLSLPALVEAYGEGIRKLLPKAVPPVATETGTLHPDQAAALFGFDGGDAFVQALLNMEKPAQVIEAETDRIMKERHGDPLHDGSIQAAAEEAVHGDPRALFLHGELRALARKAGQHPTPPQVIKGIVDRLFAEKPVRDILKPWRYQAQAVRAAKAADKAIASGDWRTAFEEKRKQLLNFEMFRRGLKAQKEVEAIRRELRRLQVKPINPRKVDPEYVGRIKNALSVYSFGPELSDKKRAALMAEATRQWIEAKQRDEDAQIVIPPRILEADSLKPWRDLSLEDLKGLRDVVKSLWKAGRENSEAEREAFAAKAEALGAGIREHIAERPDAGKVFGNHAMAARAKGMGRAYLAEHRKLESMCRTLDGHQDLGPMWEAVFKPLADAAGEKSKLVEEAMRGLDAIFGRYPQTERMRWGTTALGSGIFVPEVGETITKEEMLATALNWGNAGNREALMEGNGWKESQVEAILRHLTAKDWETVQEVWDLVDSFWPRIAALEEKTTGVVPEKVQALPFKTPDGREMRGGYYRLKADPARDGKSFRETVEERAAAVMTGRTGRATTRHGHTIERKGFGGRPVWLSLGVLMNHLGEVTQDIAYREAVRQADRVLRSGPVAEAIVATKGMEFHNTMLDLLKFTAAGPMEPLTSIERISRHIRVGVTTSTLALNVRTLATQFLGLGQSIARIGPAAMARGLVRFYGMPSRIREQVAFVQARSPMMRDRGKVFNREIAEMQAAVSLKGPLTKAQQAGFWGLVTLDMYGVSYPTWLGAYEQGMERFGGDEAKAADHADSTVRLTQGIGTPENLALVQQKNEFFRWMTILGGYFNTTVNMNVELFEKTDFARPADWPRFIGEFTAINTVPAAIGALLLEPWPKDDDGEAWTKFLLLQMLNQLSAGFVIVRDIGGGISSEFGYSPASDSAGKAATIMAKEVARAIEEGEPSAPLVKNTARLAGYVFQIPGIGQLVRTGGYVADMEAGKVEDPSLKGALLTGNRKH